MSKPIVGISLITRDRHDYLAQTLRSIREALVQWSGEVHLHFSLDQGWSPKIMEHYHAWAGPKSIVKRQKHFKTRRNAFCSLCETAELGCDLILHQEDDVLLSPDAFQLIDSFYQNGHHINGGYLALSTASVDQSKSMEVVVERAAEGLWGNGFCITPSAWRNIYSQQFWGETKYPDEWDYCIGWKVFELKIRGWRPRLNRSHNIGVFGANAHGDVPEGYKLPWQQQSTSGEFTWIE